MPILLSCPCGKQLRVSDGAAGRRIQCPSCGATQVAPDRPEGPPAQPASPALLRFQCACGKPMQARAEYAGRTARCPACGAETTIPGAGGNGASAGIRVGRRAAGPAEDGGAAAGGKRNGSTRRRARWPWAVAGLLLVLLLGGGLGAWWWVARRDANADLAYIPGNAQGFVTVRVADVWKTPATQKALDQVKQAAPEVADLPGLSEKEFGLAPADVERLTFVAADVRQKDAWVIVRTTRPYDRQKVLGKLVPGAQEREHLGVKYQAGSKANQPVGLLPVSDRIFVWGPEKSIQRCLSSRQATQVKGPLEDAIQAAGGSHHLVAGFAVPSGLPLPPGATMESAKALGPILQAQSAALVMDFGDAIQMDLTLTFHDDARAQSCHKAVTDGLEQAKKLLGNFKAQFARGPGAQQASQLIDQAEATLKGVTVEQKGKSVVARAKLDVNALVLSTGLLLPAVQKVRQAAGATTHSNNLKQLSLAMIMYADVHQGRMPPAVIRDKAGRPLYSWRVELLPYMEQQALYNEFKKDEPWDSPHNKQLLPRMPKVFELPGASAGPGKTFYQVFTGPTTPFRGPAGPRYPADFRDGTSNTILIVEAVQAVNWTEPRDVECSPGRPLKGLLGGHFPGRFYAALADGAVLAVADTITDSTLHQAVTPAGGERLGDDWYAATGQNRPPRILPPRPRGLPPLPPGVPPMRPPGNRP